jgi:hypothetical protein
MALGAEQMVILYSNMHQVGLLKGAQLTTRLPIPLSATVHTYAKLGNCYRKLITVVLKTGSIANKIVLVQCDWHIEAVIWKCQLVQKGVTSCLNYNQIQNIIMNYGLGDISLWRALIIHCHPIHQFIA